MCLYPKLIKNRKYIPNKKNGGKVPPLPLINFNGRKIEDRRVLDVPVGCQKCIECKKQKSRNWQVRLLEDIRHHKNGVFVTLTFSNESIAQLGMKFPQLDGYEKDNEIAKTAVRLFLERWRKKHKKSVRHWLVTELGHQGTENIHLHGIIWTNKPQDIEQIWKYGYNWNGTYVNEKTVNYITKYITKTDLEHKEYNPIVLTSPGIGRGYMERSDWKNNKYNKNGTKEEYRNRQGFKMAMPIYYRNKIYTEEERENLWREKLDKNERWVMGEKVNVETEKGEQNYIKLREYYRKLNKRLGYGDNSINWNQKKYERERRNINYIKRIQNNRKGTR